MTDTHCHLYAADLLPTINEVINRALAANVHQFFLPAIDSTHSKALYTVVDAFPNNCFAMAGLHPCSVKHGYEIEIQHIEDLLATKKIWGIGETGLDFYWDKTFIKQQYEALQLQIDMAIAHSLPLILHTRNAMEETIAVIKRNKHSALRGIFHCFTGSIEQANQIIEAGFYLGIGGVVTYKNAGIAEVLNSINLEHVVLETDAPYLTPVPFRGKPNESSYLKYIAEKVADIKRISLAEVDEITTHNAKKIFGV